MERKRRSLDDGYLFVVGGPGGSGSSTISKMLAEHFGLERVYAGQVFREKVKGLGYKDFEEFYKGSNKDLLLEMDREVDRELIKRSSGRDILVESKVFAAIAEKEGIPCTVKIWLDASVHIRTLRHLGKEDVSGFFSRFFAYFRIRRSLLKRERLDSERYMELYSVDYSKQGLYNDFVINSSFMNVEETFNLILEKLEDAGFIKK